MTSEIVAMVGTTEFWVGVGVALAFEELVKDRLSKRIKDALQSDDAPGGEN